MTAQVRPIVMEQGATWHWGFSLFEPGPVVNGVITPGEPKDLTGCTVRMQVRRTLTAEPAVDASTDNGMILLDAPGHVTFRIPEPETMKKTFEEGLYDIELVWPSEAAGGTVRLFEGPVTGTLNVTRPVA